MARRGPATSVSRFELSLHPRGDLRSRHGVRHSLSENMAQSKIIKCHLIAFIFEEENMSHFYRLRTVNDSFGKGCGIDWFDTDSWPGIQPEWRRAMEEVPVNPPWPHCRIFCAPPMPPGSEAIRFLFNMKPGAVFPDVWFFGALALVSGRTKRILESCDDFGHEYIETEIQDANRRKINREHYYLLNVRRILKIDELGPYGAIENKFEMFCPHDIEERFLPVVQRTPELKEKLSRLPMWRQHGMWDVVYISEDVLQALRDAGVTGIDPYTNYDGKPCEALARFE